MSQILWGATVRTPHCVWRGIVSHYRISDFCFKRMIFCFKRISLVSVVRLDLLLQVLLVALVSATDTSQEPSFNCLCSS